VIVSAPSPVVIVTSLFVVAPLISIERVFVPVRAAPSTILIPSSASSPNSKVCPFSFARTNFSIPLTFVNAVSLNVAAPTKVRVSTPLPFPPPVSVSADVK